MHVKRDDEVLVLAGNDKGKRGRVMVVYPTTEKALVEGVNMTTHHEKPSQENPQGGRLKREAPVHISNLMVIDPNSDEPTRIGRKRVEEEGGGRWVRYAKNSGEIIDK
uniref:50S ribosomal protein L24 n=1 Tax=Rhodohalobacter sp. 8-1 TaxID=3131972 RepID=UPI0030EF1F41